MPTRRTTILGLGALAMGSGAAFTSAAFQSDVDAGADFRVVVDEELLVEAGAAFRDSTGDYTSSAVSDDSDFTASELDFNDTSRLPVAFVNDEQNDELETEVATGLGETTFGDMLQVVNETFEDVSIGITFTEYGDDATAKQPEDGTGTGDGPVSRSTIRDIYTFEDGGSRISQGPSDPTDVTDSNDWSQDIGAGTLSVNSGQTEQINLNVDVAESDIEDAIDLSASFGEDTDDVDLVEEITIGKVE